MNYYRNKQQPPGVLLQYLSKHDFPLGQLLAIPNIISDIKNNIHKFIQYLSTRKNMAEELIYYATRLKQSQLQQQPYRQYCFVAIQILSNEDEELVDLFFKPRSKSSDNEEIEEEIAADKEMDLLLSNDEDIIPEGGNSFHPEQMLKYLMNYLFEGDTDNEICNNYFSKIIISLIRKSGNNFIAFMINNPQYLAQLLTKIESLSLGIILIKTLIIDTEECELSGVTTQQCKQYKLHIVNQLKQIYFSKLKDIDFCESIELLINEGFESVKNKYFQFPEDLVDSFNSLVNQQTINMFFTKITSSEKENQLTSLSMILNQIIKKYNRQIEEHYQNQTNKKNIKVMEEGDFILKFQISEVVNNFSQFIKVMDKQYFSAVSLLSKHRFTTLLIEISKVQKVWQTQVRFEESIKILLNQFNRSIGVLQNDLFLLIKTFVQKCPSQLLETFSFQKLQFNLNPQELEQLKVINNSINFGPKLSLLLLIDSKRSKDVFQNSEQLNNILNQYRTKHNHVLGGTEPQAKNHKWSDFSSDQTTKIFSKSIDEDKVNDSISKMVGKLKNIAIPNLRYMNEIKNVKSEKTDERGEQLDIYVGDEKINIIQVQEQQIVITLQNLQNQEEDQDQICMPSNRVTNRPSQQPPAVVQKKQEPIKQEKVSTIPPPQKQLKVEHKPVEPKQKNKQQIAFYSSIYMII